jgi:hypothetical protein
VNVVDAANIVAAAGGLGAIGALVWIAARPDTEREAEEAARAYYDAHGRWPDDEPERR